MQKPAATINAMTIWRLLLCTSAFGADDFLFDQTCPCPDDHALLRQTRGPQIDQCIAAVGSHQAFGALPGRY